jgi:hypothetical protein
VRTILGFTKETRQFLDTFKEEEDAHATAVVDD